MQKVSKSSEVSKLDKSSEIKDEHPENILLIVETLFVLKLDKFNDVKDEQSENKAVIPQHEVVLKLDKFIDVKFLHLENIEYIIVTCDVSI